jgi:hypothetical protein
MTIIAWDGKSLVADGRCTRLDGSLVSDKYTKLFRVRIKELGDCVIGLCGAPDTFGPFLLHLEKNGLVPLDHFNFNSPEEQAGFHATGLAVNRKGKCFEISVDGGWYEVTGCAATGSGEKIALHFLNKGCDAVESVIETCETELSCGGTLLSYDWKSDKFTQIDLKSS